MRKIDKVVIINLCLILIITGLGLNKSITKAVKANSVINKTVVIDPGHGGIDGGAHDQTLLEKNINLDVGLKLKFHLESKGVKVVMTRTTDTSLEDQSDLNSSRYRRDLHARKDIANNANADLLVSIHVNTSPKHLDERGVIIFYFKDSGQSKELAGMIKSSIEATIYQQYYSNKTTELIPQNFYILREVNMPSNLIEIGFLSNSEDRLLLQDEDYKNRMAEAICDGIIGYLWFGTPADGKL